MAKKVKLTEADLNRIVKKVMNEAPRLNPSMVNRLANGGSGQQQGSGAGGWTGAAAKSIAAMNNPKVKALATYLKQNQIKPADISAAFQLNRGQGAAGQAAAQAAKRPTQPQQSGSWFDKAGQAVRNGINTVQDYERQGLNKLSQGLSSVANAVKPKTQGGVAKAAQPTSGSGQGTTKPAQPTSGSGQGTTKPVQPTSGSGQGTTKPVQQPNNRFNEM
jgi:hypothetical protein